MSARPFFNFAGGKTRLLPQLLPLMPLDFEAYHEPFLGGGAVFFALATDPRVQGFAGMSRAFLSDSNKEIVCAFRAVRDHLPELEKMLARHASLHSEAYYGAVRDQEPGILDDVVTIAARFLYINRAGFNGLYRVNKAGRCNVSWGKRAKVVFDHENMKACELALRGVNVHRSGYARVIRRADGGDLVYLDSPYEGTFDGYGSKPFRGADHDELAEVAKELARRGCLVVLSAADTPACRARYEGWDLHEASVHRSISGDKAKRGKASELIIRSPNLAGYRRPE